MIGSLGIPSSQLIRTAMDRLGLSRPWAVLFPPRPTGSESRKADGLWASRYDTLDLWRALVAIGIVLHHAGHFSFGLNTGRVILFFVISGYCIAASAESCLRRGMSAGEFFWRRLRRIYPPFLLAVLFWIGTRLIKIWRGGPNDLLYRLDGTPRTITEWVLNLTSMQWMWTVGSPVERPGDNPILFVAAYWSLGYEEQFYLVVSLMFGLALLVPWCRLRWMIPALVPIALAYGMSLPQHVRGIFIEFWTAFSVGACVYYRLSVFKDRRWRLAVDLALIVLIAMGLIGLIVDTRIGQEIDRSKWHEWLIAGVFGLALVFLRPADRWINRRLLSIPLRAIGRITYSLFLIHQFNLTLISSVAKELLRPIGHARIADLTTPLVRLYDSDFVAPADPLTHPGFGIVWLSVQIALHLGLAVVFWRFCEYPFLNRSDDGPPPAVKTGVSGIAAGPISSSDKPAT